MTDRISPIFIDNTNIEAWTMKQYVVDVSIVVQILRHRYYKNSFLNYKKSD